MMNQMEWEIRPGGMMVQKRSDRYAADGLQPKIRVRVAYGAVRHEIFLSPQETFGGLKKLLTAETGLRPEEQRLIFKGKEGDDGDFLDTSGVKDRSKVVLIQDPVSIERRYVEMRRNAKIQTVRPAISDVSVEIDNLAEQVSIVEESITKGHKVPEVRITTLIEMLMRHAVKLDNISAEGEVASSKKSQEKRVQTCVETLDVLKVSNAKIKPVVVTTTWETFGGSPTCLSYPRRADPSPWELFD